MNTKDLLREAIEALKVGNNLEAQEKINQAYTADADNTYEDLCYSLYNSILLEDDNIASKFRNMYQKNITKESEKIDNGPIIINNNNNNNNNNNSGDHKPVHIKYKKKCSRKTSLLLCLFGFLGIAGLHKFYEGDKVKGILYLFTCGLFFIGTIRDYSDIKRKDEIYYIY